MLCLSFLTLALSGHRPKVGRERGHKHRFPMGGNYIAMIEMEQPAMFCRGRGRWKICCFRRQEANRRRHCIGQVDAHAQAERAGGFALHNQQRVEFTQSNSAMIRQTAA